ncbi:hypothetical protein X943_000943 [Babesia divergens]|uniref:SAM-dependent MTase RsmB/NOP-type domain-containing protein n=1 Tax=Babesia divergens TaxID=32595 RepID=A0AAD9GCR1_BABDI|nr:hypothetical protein X943_000943 [Babesia divergens]
MCDSSQLSNGTAEGSTGKRRKKASVVNPLSCSDNSVELPSAIRSWIAHIGVNLEEYQHSLYQVASGSKKRYYRLQSNLQSAPDESECAGGQFKPPDASEEQGPHAGCASAGSVESSPAAVSHYRSQSIQDESPKVDVRCSMASTHRVRHPVVRWLRDVKLYACYESIPKEAMGLDAASAAVVDSMRLRDLSHEDGTKWILDMCCAPGGKLLGMVSSLKALCREGVKWKVIGLDVVKRRLDVCASFLKRENPPPGIDVFLVNSRGQDFTEFEGTPLMGCFDRVLVDAECTHEGSLRSVIRTLKYWGSSSLETRLTPEHADGIISNQRELLMHAIRLVRPGGLVIYSTCSLHDEQNELLVSDVLQRFDNVKLQQLPMVYCECCSPPSDRTEKWPARSTEEFLREHCPSRYLPDRSGSGVPKCANSDSPVCVRFSPLEPETDGIFIAAIRKLSE